MQNGVTYSSASHDVMWLAIAVVTDKGWTKFVCRNWYYRLDMKTQQVLDGFTLTYKPKPCNSPMISIDTLPSITATSNWITIALQFIPAHRCDV